MDLDKFKIVTYSDDLRIPIINFLKDITIGEFGYKEWNDYFDNKSFEPYKTDYSKFLVVFDKDKIVATIGGLQVDEETIKLNSFYIKKEYRHHGLGSYLYDEIMNFAKRMKYKYMILCTFDKFDVAESYYQRKGFKLFKIDDDARWYKKEI